MPQDCNCQRMRKCFFFAINLVLVISMAACGNNGGEIRNLPGENIEPPFKLLILSNVGEKRLSHRATQPEYRDWLNNVDLTDVQFSLDNASISSFTPKKNEYSQSISLTLNTSASRDMIGFLTPSAEVDSALNGEYSLGCMVEEKAFLVVVQGKRIVGGTLRCPTEMVYTHPEMYAVSHRGKVLLDFGMTSASEFTQIIWSLELARVPVR